MKVTNESLELGVCNPQTELLSPLDFEEWLEERNFLLDFSSPVFYYTNLSQFFVHHNYAKSFSAYDVEPYNAKYAYLTFLCVCLYRMTQ
jgi:hypothetical protein